MYRAEFRRVEGRYIRFEIQVHQSSDSVLSRRSRYPSLDKMKKWTVWSHQRLLTPHRRCSARLPGARTRPRARARPRRRSRTRPRRDERDRARHRPSPVAPGASSSATFVRGWRRTHPRAGVPHPRTRRASAAPCPPPRDPPRGICARMRCVRRHHAAIASTRAFRLSAARSPAPASRLVARDIDEMPVGHHPRVVGSVIAESRLSPLPSLDLRPIAQPRRPALASPGAFDAPSKTAPGDPRALSLSGDALAEDVAVAPSASASAGVDWERFAARQLSRHVPVAPDGLVLSDTPRGYRLRVHAVEEYPFGPEPHRRRRTRPLARGAVRAVLLRRSHRILPRRDVQQPPRGDENPRRGSCSRGFRKPRRRARGYPGRPARRLLHHPRSRRAVPGGCRDCRRGTRGRSRRSRNLGGMGGDPDARRGRRRTLGKRERRARARGIAEVSHVGSTPRGTTPAVAPRTREDALRARTVRRRARRRRRRTGRFPGDVRRRHPGGVTFRRARNAHVRRTRRHHHTRRTAPRAGATRRDAWSARLPPRRIRRRRRRRV